jgi:phosphoribosylformylglycinamidine cyclo-ligase
VAGGYAGVVRFGELRVAVTSDGIGTKIELAERTGMYRTLGYDLVAMVVDDLAAGGAVPTTLTDVLDADVLDERVVAELMEGLAAAAAEARVAVVGGEIAELSGRIAGYGAGMHFNWCATALGYIPEGREALDGTAVRAGDEVVALASPGFRSNGFSLVRKVMEERFGAGWHDAEVTGTAGWNGRRWGEALLEPSRIFCAAVERMFEEGLPVHGIAHVTGGGIPGKLGRVLRPNGLGAVLDHLLPPDGLVLRVQELGGIAEEEAYRLWNMGNGMMVVVERGAAERVVQCAAGFRIPARCAGRVTPGSGIVLQGRGCEGARLEYSVGR